MNKIVPVFRCANDRSHVLRKRDEKADQPGHYFAECSECRSDSTKKAEEEENESSNIGEEITNVKQLGTTSQPRTSDIPAHPTRGHGERTTQISSHGHHRAHSTSEHQYQLQSPPPPLQTINSPTRIPRLGMRNRNEILSPETRPVRQNLRSRLPSIDESYSRSTTPSYGTPPASSTPRKGLPLAILPVMVTETETDDESTMSCENSSLVGESSILEPPPIRLNRATRLGHFAQPTQAFLNRIVRTPNPVATATPSPRPPPSSKRPFISGIMQRGVQTSTQKTNMAGGRLPLQEVGQGIRIVGGTDSPRPSFGRGGGKKREAERRDSGNGNRHRDGERRAAKQRLLVFSRASLGE